MSALAEIDFALLPAPAVIEPLDYEIILAALKADLLVRDSRLTAVSLDSEPIAKLLEVAAYRELLLRARVNDGAHAIMLAYATGTDLDAIGANYGVVRLVVTPANATAVPPIAAVMEPDVDLRARIRLALYIRTTAGPTKQYIFYALSADPDVADVSVTSPQPGDVIIAVLSRTDPGTPAQAVLDAVTAAVNDSDTRPLTDHVIVQAAAIVNYTITAALTLYPGPDPVMVEATALAAVTAFAALHHAMGHDITRAGLIAALTVGGVQNVALTAPAVDVVIDDLSASHALGITVTVAGVAV